jgi:hypothetical protein
LPQRVKPTGGLDEDQQSWPGHQQRDQAQLLLVAARVVAVVPRQVEVQPLRQGLDGLTRHASSKPGQQDQHLPAPHAPELGELPGQVAEHPLDPYRVRCDVDAEDLG